MEKESSCFTGGSDFQSVNQRAKTLHAACTAGRLTKAYDR